MINMKPACMRTQRLALGKAATPPPCATAHNWVQYYSWHICCILQAQLRSVVNHLPTVPLETVSRKPWHAYKGHRATRL
uniref:Uncharacterized protein n=1 Tax=Leersia perrieri TaxID=77586 RepID=A0A0D9VEX5_9ORYZ